MLRKNAKSSVREIANKLRLTKSTVHDRIKRLEKNGIIKGYKVIPDYHSVEEGFSAYVQIAAIKTPVLGNLGTYIKEIHHTDGEYDMLLKIRCRDISSFNQIMLTLKKDPSIRKLQSTIVMHTEREEL